MRVNSSLSSIAEVVVGDDVLFDGLTARELLAGIREKRVSVDDEPATSAVLELKTRLLVCIFNRDEVVVRWLRLLSRHVARAERDDTTDCAGKCRLTVIIASLIISIS